MYKSVSLRPIDMQVSFSFLHGSVYKILSKSVFVLHNLSECPFVNTLCRGSTGFPQRLENLENESGHGKVMEHEQ